jgi:hypothetical protein
LDRTVSLPNHGGNAFIADLSHGAAPAGVGGGPEARVHWTDAHSLQIAHHEAARVYLARQTVSGVTIRYTSFH